MKTLWKLWMWLFLNISKRLQERSSNVMFAMLSCSILLQQAVVIHSVENVLPEFWITITYAPFAGGDYQCRPESKLNQVTNAYLSFSMAWFQIW
jgi:hypothetical protein